MTTEKLGQKMKEHLAQHHFGVFFIKGFEVCWVSKCESQVACFCRTQCWKYTS